jgi:hypothetical protein
MTTATTTTPNAIDELQAQGFVEGPPAHIDAVTLMADIDSYRRMACESCGKRRQRVLPFNRGEDYAIVTVCCGCGHACEP